MIVSPSKLSWLDKLRLARDVDARLHWGQNAEDAVLGRIFGQKKNGLYVDIGAHHPRRFSNTYLLHRFFGWSGINVDASKRSIDQFALKRPKDVNVWALIGDPGSNMLFTEFANRGARNSAHPSFVARSVERGEKIVSETEMEPRTLASILDEHLKRRSIDLLSIDIEGFDLAALTTNNWEKYRPTVICIEDFAFRESNSSAIRVFLESLGYVLVSHCFDTSIYQDIAGHV